VNDKRNWSARFPRQDYNNNSNSNKHPTTTTTFI